MEKKGSYDYKLAIQIKAAYMKNQVKWGLALIVLGLAIALIMLPFPASFPFLLVYSLPLLVLGGGLIRFRNREEQMDEVEGNDQRRAMR